MIEKIKRFLLMFLYSIFVMYILYRGEIYKNIVRQKANSTFDFTTAATVSMLYPILLGMLIAIPYVISEIRKQGKWNYDWLKAVAIGIPALYLVAYNLIFVFQLPFFQYLYPMRVYVLFISNQTVFFGGLILGYVVLTSLYKETTDADSNLK